jgi:uncharacterized protein (TIGR04222 family)
MNNTLWKSIQDFNLDHPLSAYGFSTRLSGENGWPEYFTQKAILEYKKFMYLAATTDGMVSPSAIVDVVWHQHLIFTQSYSSFCDVLGKKVEHIPSLHNRNEAVAFKRARERTQQLYEIAFGKQPPEVWEYTRLYEPLQLKGTGIKLWMVVLLGVLACGVLFTPAYSLLEGFYHKLNNPYFLIGYLLLLATAFIALEAFNRKSMHTLINRWDRSAFIFNLSPSELVYLQKGDLGPIVNGYLNQLLEREKLRIHKPFLIPAKEPVDYDTAIELTIIDTVKAHKRITYKALLKELLTQPVFTNTAKALKSFKKQVNGSLPIISLFALNVSVLVLLFVAGMIRLDIGMQREKPVGLLAMVLFVFICFASYFLYRTANLLTAYIIPQCYKKDIVPATPAASWEWDYFLSGQAALSTTMLLLMTSSDTRSASGDGGSYSNSDGGDAGGCGSACGGCGGGD